MNRDSVGYVIDDSDLFHYSKGYDPVKAREYYLRTRKLKGRRPGVTNDHREFKKAATGNEGKYARFRTDKPNRSKTKSRREELERQKKALEARLERLRDVLAELVEAAKKRSGGDPNKKGEKKDTKESTQSKGSKSKKSKDKPETAAEKKERAKKAKEEYEKEHPNSLSQDVEVLKSQVEDIQKKIRKALDDAREARERRNTAGKNDTRSGSKNNSDGPRGR